MEVAATPTNVDDPTGTMRIACVECPCDVSRDTAIVKNCRLIVCVGIQRRLSLCLQWLLLQPAMDGSWSASCNRLPCGA
jgi:hypothetical protein